MEPRITREPADDVRTQVIWLLLAVFLSSGLVRSCYLPGPLDACPFLLYVNPFSLYVNPFSPDGGRSFFRIYSSCKYEKQALPLLLIPEPELPVPVIRVNPIQSLLRAVMNLESFLSLSTHSRRSCGFVFNSACNFGRDVIT
jgi:hypothetical protein